jgi:hypothetical protein
MADPTEDNDASVNIREELDRVYSLYTSCTRDYFATFGVYATATSILLAAMGFVASQAASRGLIMVLAVIGMYLCLQWHISTTSMRDQYTHFYVRMVDLERVLGLKVMLRWRDAAGAARGRPTFSPDVAEKDQRYLTWSFRQLGRLWGLRAASMPVITAPSFWRSASH